MSNERPGGELYVSHRYWPMDEDCLNLNVWTPGLDDQKRPVLVWLHGGGYEAGSSIEQIAYDGANMAFLGNVVVIRYMAPVIARQMARSSAEIQH